MESLTPEGRTLVEQVAQRNNVSMDAVVTLLRALDRGGGTQAQFSHPDLGGMGQWSRGGMIMVGDMFNNGLKARVDQLCNELSDGLRNHVLFTPEARATSWDGAWWPAEFGTPSSSGSQNDLSYACFPDSRRLATRSGGIVRVYDTGEHRIGGVSQQQGGGQDLSFTSQFGTVRLHELAPVGDDVSTPVPTRPAPDVARAPPQEAPDAPTYTTHFEAPRAALSQGRIATSPPNVPSSADEDVFGKIERLHDLHRKGILSEAEFAEKKKELLARL